MTKAVILSWCSSRIDEQCEFPYRRTEYFFAPAEYQGDDYRGDWENMLSWNVGKQHRPEIYARNVQDWAASRGVKITIKEIVAAFRQNRS